MKRRRVHVTGVAAPVRCPLAECWHFSTQPQALRLHLYAAHRFADADALAAAVETFDGHPPLLLPVDGQLVNFRGPA